VQFAEEAWQKHVDSVVENKLSSAEKKKKEILEQKKVSNSTSPTLSALSMRYKYLTMINQ
jgi:hypothetical protein